MMFFFVFLTLKRLIYDFYFGRNRNLSNLSHFFLILPCHPLFGWVSLVAANSFHLACRVLLFAATLDSLSYSYVSVRNSIFSGITPAHREWTFSIIQTSFCLQINVDDDTVQISVVNSQYRLPIVMISRATHFCFWQRKKKKQSMVRRHFGVFNTHANIERLPHIKCTYYAASVATVRLTKKKWQRHKSLWP